MTNKLLPQTKACYNCPFASRNPLPLDPNTYQTIINYLGEGQNHICHNSKNKVCRGGREVQLKIFCAQGWIEEPTDAALAEAMQNMGIAPKQHING